MSMTRILGIALLISLLGNGVLLYRILDVAVTASYRGAEIGYTDKQVADAQKLLPLLMSNISRRTLLNAAKEAGLEVIDKGEDGVYVGAIEFVLSKDKVVAVKFE